MTSSTVVTIGLLTGFCFHRTLPPLPPSRPRGPASYQLHASHIKPERERSEKEIKREREARKREKEIKRREREKERP